MSTITAIEHLVRELGRLSKRARDCIVTITKERGGMKREEVVELVGTDSPDSQAPSSPPPPLRGELFSAQLRRR